MDLALITCNGWCDTKSNNQMIDWEQVLLSIKQTKDKNYEKEYNILSR